MLTLVRNESAAYTIMQTVLSDTVFFFLIAEMVRKLGDTAADEHRLRHMEKASARTTGFNPFIKNLACTAPLTRPSRITSGPELHKNTVAPVVTIIAHSAAIFAINWYQKNFIQQMAPSLTSLWSAGPATADNPLKRRKLTTTEVTIHRKSC